MFTPKRILFEKKALDYPIGKHIYQTFITNKAVDIIELRGNKIKENIPNDTLSLLYQEGKNTLVVGVKKGSSFQSCKPSAHYQLPLLSGCIGHCQYCYLNTHMGDKPYMRVNVNVDDILSQAESLIKQRSPQITIFEGSATSDPVPVEPYSHLLKQAIEYFSQSKEGRFRFVTKFTDVDTLLGLDHQEHTEIRFTLNTDWIIKNYENRTPSLAKRIEAAHKVMASGYPTGFLIAPVFLYQGWKEDYYHLLLDLHENLPKKLVHPLTFEVISHRYTTQAKNIITEIFPDNQLPMNNEERSYRFGQFGYGKYVYTKESLMEMSEYFRTLLEDIFRDRVISIKYII